MDAGGGEPERSFLHSPFPFCSPPLCCCGLKSSPGPPKPVQTVASVGSGTHHLSPERSTLYRHQIPGKETLPVVCGAGTPSSPFKICSCLHTTTTPRQTHIMIPTTRSIPPTPATTLNYTDTIQPQTISPTPLRTQASSPTTSSTRALLPTPNSLPSSPSTRPPREPKSGPVQQKEINNSRRNPDKETKPSPAPHSRTQLQPSSRNQRPDTAKPEKLKKEPTSLKSRKTSTLPVRNRNPWSRSSYSRRPIAVFVITSTTPYAIRSPPLMRRWSAADCTGCPVWLPPLFWRSPLPWKPPTHLLATLQSPTPQPSPAHRLDRIPLSHPSNSSQSCCPLYQVLSSLQNPAAHSLHSRPQIPTKQGWPHALQSHCRQFQ